MLAQAERQAKVDCIDKLSPFQDQITAPSNRPDVLLNDLGQHVVGGRQSTNPDGSRALLVVRDGMEEFPEIIQGWRKHHLIVWVGRNLEHWDSDDVTDDLRINSDEMVGNRGLKHHSVIIVLHHFQVGVEQLDQYGIHHTSTAVEISPIVRLDNGKYVVQRGHHDISPKDVLLSNDSAVHNLGLNCSPIFHNPLTDPAGWTACRHDSAKDPTRILQKGYSKNILVRITKIWQNNSSKRTCVKIKTE
jgi:hypothetical protein